MRIISLKNIELDSSTVAASPYTEYASGTTYASGNNVKVSLESDGTTPRTPVEEYQSSADSNTGNYPPDNPSQWTPLGSSNRWKMFDDYTDSQTENTTSIEVEIDAGGCNAVGLFNLQAISVDFELTAESEVKKSDSVDMSIMPAGNWWSYFSEDVQFRNDLIWVFPRYSEATLKITITNYTGATAKCGMVAIGSIKELGKTQYDVKVSISDYSKKDTDSIGRTYLSQGNWAKHADLSFWLKNDQIDSVRKNFTDLRGTATVFDCNNYENGYESLLIYGFFRNFFIVIPGPNVSECNIEIEGLI